MLKIASAMLCVGLAGIFGVGTAQADGELIAVCMVLDDYPNISGVTGVLDALMEGGYSAYQAGRIVGTAAKQVCPEHLALVQRYAYALA